MTEWTGPALLAGGFGLTLLALSRRGQAAEHGTFGGALLVVAQRDVGVHEQGGKNRGPRVDEMLARVGQPPGQAWCAAALSTWIYEAAATLGVKPPIPGSASAKAVMMQLQQIGGWRPIEALRSAPALLAPGMIVVWWRGSPDDWTGHIGVVEAPPDVAGVFTTIEGNSGPAGDAVARVRRSLLDERLLGAGTLDAASLTSVAGLGAVAVAAENLTAYEADIRRDVPAFEVAWKTDSPTQKLIGAVVHPFNPEYMTAYTTTVYPLVYFPSRTFYEEDPTASFNVLAHERVHLHDTQAQPIWFRLSYLFPQVLAAPLLLGAGVLAVRKSEHWVWALAAGLAALLPWSAPGRTHWERRGYAATMAVRYWRTGDIPAALKDMVRRQMLGPYYYYMSSDAADTDRWIAETEAKIRSGELAQEEPYASTYRFMARHGLLAPSFAAPT